MQDSQVSAAEDIGKLKTSMALFKRLDSWIGFKACDWLYSKRWRAINTLFSVVTIDSRYLGYEDLGTYRRTMFKAASVSGTIIDGATGEWSDQHYRASIYNFDGVWAWHPRPSCEFYSSSDMVLVCRKQDKEQLVQILRRIALRQRTVSGYTVRVKTEFTSGTKLNGETSTSSRWVHFHHPTLLRTLDDVPIHSEIKPILLELVDELRAHWYPGEDVELDRAFRERMMSRTYLFHGPRGSGKTSIAYALAAELGTQSYDYPKVAYSADFWSLVAGISSQSVVIADECNDRPDFTGKDAIANNAGMFGDVPLAVDDTLSYLTGPRQPDGVLTVMCTNKPDDLDDRIRRRGRTDKTLFIAEVDDAGIKEWFRNKHSLTFGDDVTFIPTLAADIFAGLQDLHSPEALAEKLKVKS